MNHLQICHSLTVLGWYISGLSELPLENRLSLLLAGPFQRFCVFSIFLLGLSIICPLFFISIVCVHVLRARHRGRAYRRRGCQRVLAGGGGVARSAVAARRCLCLETRTMY